MPECNALLSCPLTRYNNCIKLPPKEAISILETCYTINSNLPLRLTLVHLKSILLLWDLKIASQDYNLCSRLFVIIRATQRSSLNSDILDSIVSIYIQSLLFIQHDFDLQQLIILIHDNRLRESIGQMVLYNQNDRFESVENNTINYNNLGVYFHRKNLFILSRIMFEKSLLAVEDENDRLVIEMYLKHTISCSVKT